MSFGIYMLSENIPSIDTFDAEDAQEYTRGLFSSLNTMEGLTFNICEWNCSVWSRDF